MSSIYYYKSVYIPLTPVYEVYKSYHALVRPNDITMNS